MPHISPCNRHFHRIFSLLTMCVKETGFKFKFRMSFGLSANYRNDESGSDIEEIDNDEEPSLRDVLRSVTSLSKSVQELKKQVNTAAGSSSAVTTEMGTTTTSHGHAYHLAAAGQTYPYSRQADLLTTTLAVGLLAILLRSRRRPARFLQPLVHGVYQMRSGSELRRDTCSPRSQPPRLLVFTLILSQRSLQEEGGRGQ